MQGKCIMVLWVVMWVACANVGVAGQGGGLEWWTSTVPPNHPAETGVQCQCVPFFLCVDGVINTYGEDLLDIRTIPVTNVARCPAFDEVCCGLPEDEANSTVLLAPDTPCTCESLNSCPLDRVVADNRGVTTLEHHTLGNYSHSQCQSFQVCCADASPTPSPTVPSTSISTSPSTPDSDAPQYHCVPQMLCDAQGLIITTGLGVINPRDRLNISNPQPRGTCDNPHEVCCRLLPRPNDSRSSSGCSPFTSTASTSTTTSTTTTTTTTTVAPTSTAGCFGQRNTLGLQARILGFTNGESQFGEFPWVAAVLLNNNASVLGGGTLVHPRVVLTAAHIVAGRRVRDLVVRLGEWDVRTKQEPYLHQDVQVAEVLLHPSFHPDSLKNDFALLFLKEAPTGPHIAPICLASRLNQVNRKQCVINGWGLDKFETGVHQFIMKSVTLPMVGSQKCQRALRNTILGKSFELHASFVCAGGEEGRDACKGDGGGPLACPVKGRTGGSRYLLVGVTSWGIGCGTAGLPGVYARVPNGIAWIRRSISQYPFDSPTSTPAPVSTPDKSVNSILQLASSKISSKNSLN